MQDDPNTREALLDILEEMGLDKRLYGMTPTDEIAVIVTRLKLGTGVKASSNQAPRRFKLRMYNNRDESDLTMIYCLNYQFYSDSGHPLEEYQWWRRDSGLYVVQYRAVGSKIWCLSITWYMEFVGHVFDNPPNPHSRLISTKPGTKLD